MTAGDRSKLPLGGAYEAIAGLLVAVGLAAVAFPLTVAGPRAQTNASEDVTFAKDVAPIVYENCVYCHRPGEVAPFSLLTYKDARPWARSIKQKVAGSRCRRGRPTRISVSFRTPRS